MEHWEHRWAEKSVGKRTKTGSGNVNMTNKEGAYKIKLDLTEYNMQMMFFFLLQINQHIIITQFLLLEYIC